MLLSNEGARRLDAAKQSSTARERPLQLPAMPAAGALPRSSNRTLCRSFAGPFWHRLVGITKAQPLYVFWKISKLEWPPSMFCCACRTDSPAEHVLFSFHRSLGRAMRCCSVAVMVLHVLLLPRLFRFLDIDLSSLNSGRTAWAHLHVTTLQLRRVSCSGLGFTSVSSTVAPPNLAGLFLCSPHDGLRL